MKTERILLVDDEPEVLSALCLRLGDRYDIEISNDPFEALELIAFEEPFSVIMSDLRMPKMDGIEFLEKAQELSPRSSAILLTGQGAFENAVEALNSGVIFKYLSKPCERLDINNALIEGVNKYKELTEQSRDLEEYSKENHIAEILQDQLVFSKADFGEGIDFAIKSSSQKKVTGDFFEVIPYKNQCYDVIIADVMGKGLPAAIIGAATKNTLHQKINNMMAQSSCLPSLSSIVCALEREMYTKLVEAKIFITMFYLRIDLQANMISYISCGHPGALLMKENKNEYYYLHGRSLPLGAIPASGHRPIDMYFERGDQLIMYSDGIVDGLNEYDDCEPVELLLDCLDGDEGTSNEVVDKVFSHVNLIGGDKDDMMIISMKLLGDAGNKSRKKKFLRRQVEDIFELNKFLRESTADYNDLFRVAVIETFTNIVEHSKDSNSAIEVHVDIDTANSTVVYMRYAGKGFIPQEIKQPDCSHQSRGFGLFLIEKICQNVQYFKDEDGMNCVCMIAQKEEAHVS